MASFYVFLLFQPFCLADLLASLSAGLPTSCWSIFQPFWSAGLPASLLHQRATCFTQARKQEGQPVKKGGRLADKEDGRSTNQEG
ncbi:selenide, water dikinase SelD [Sesbania bispinosa]|nr:selenide, water dikinase SelD [Sesbania bispinosa]